VKPRLDGDERVQRFHRLHDEGRVYEPLGVVLQRLCSELAAILPADVVSVYLREQSAADEDLLVMRANYGFTRVAVGNVQLRVGEGITGTAAELGRVVAGEADHDRFARVEGLREERFPHFLALPILRHGDVLGVLVLQRAADDLFSPDDVTLASACVGAFALALRGERARRAAAQQARRGEAPRQVRLKGRPLVPGVALGRAELLQALGRVDALSETPQGDEVSEAFGAVARRLGQRVDGLMESVDETLAAELGNVRLLLLDERFRRSAVEETQARGVSAGLSALARRYALAPLQTASGPELDWLERRAAEITALCRLVYAELQHRPVVRPGGALLLTEAPGGLLCLDLLGRRPSAVVMADPMARESLGARLLQHAGIPTLASVGGLFAWVREGDPLLIDADEGFLHVHPSPELTARARATGDAPGR